MIKSCFSRISIRTIVLVLLLGIVLLAVVLTFLGSAAYRQLVFDNKQAFTQQLMALKSGDILKQLHEKTEEMGISLQRQQDFREAFKTRDTRELRQLLHNQYYQYFVTANVLEIKRLSLFDKALSPILSVDNPRMIHHLPARLCGNVINQAKRRIGAERSKVLGALCHVEDRAYYSLLVPVGGLIPKGYLQIVVDPVLNLQALAKSLGMNVQIVQTDGHIAYQSEQWPDSGMQDYVLTDYPLATVNDEVLLHLMTTEDISTYNREVKQTEKLVLWIVLAVVGVGILIVSLVLHYALLKPLTDIINYMHNIEQEKSQLNQPLPLSGASEMVHLSQRFNQMGNRLFGKYQQLEYKASVDGLTKLPNRDCFYRVMERVLDRIPANAKHPAAVFMMDLNKFKQVNDQYGHQLGDKLLMVVAKRLTQQLNLLEPNVVMTESPSFWMVDDHQFIARLGGDEFVLLLPKVTDKQAMLSLAQAIYDEMQHPFIIDDLSLDVGMSIGIAVAPKDGLSRRDLMHHADLAMYHAKTEDKGIAEYDSALDE